MFGLEPALTVTVVLTSMPCGLTRVDQEWVRETSRISGAQLAANTGDLEVSVHISGHAAALHTALSMILVFFRDLEATAGKDGTSSTHVPNVSRHELQLVVRAQLIPKLIGEHGRMIREAETRSGGCTFDFGTTIEPNADTESAARCVLRGSLSQVCTGCVIVAEHTHALETMPRRADHKWVLCVRCGAPNASRTVIAPTKLEAPMRWCAECAAQEQLAAVSDDRHAHTRFAKRRSSKELRQQKRRTAILKWADTSSPQRCGLWTIKRCPQLTKQQTCTRRHECMRCGFVDRDYAHAFCPRCPHKWWKSEDI